MTKFSIMYYKTFKDNTLFEDSLKSDYGFNALIEANFTPLDAEADVQLPKNLENHLIETLR